MPSVAGHHVDKNPAFEALHPRDRSGHDRGRFVDVPGLFKGLGGTWDPDRGVWLVPQSNRAQLKTALDEIGFDLLHVPPKMRPMRDDDKEKRFGPNMKIPPGWTDVFVSDDPEAPVQVIGRDRKGKRQRIQSVEFSEAGAADKFARVRILDQHISEVDEKLSAEAMKSDTAAVAMLVRKMGLRPGSLKKQGDVFAYAATTLERRHVKVRGDVVYLDFIGKEGVRNKLELEDAELAKVLKKRLRGKQGNERLWSVNDRRLNGWFKTNAFGATAKDFRTRLATAEARRFLQDFDAPTDDKEARFQQLRTGEHVSKILGNTREQALESYIDPSVFELSSTGAPIGELHPGLRVRTKASLSGTINRIDEEWEGEGPIRHKRSKVVVDLDNGTQGTFHAGFLEPAPNMPPPKPQIHQSGHAPGTILIDKEGRWLTVLNVDQRAADYASKNGDIWVQKPGGIHDVVSLDGLETEADHDARLDAEEAVREAEAIKPWSRGNPLRTHDHVVQAGQFRYQQLMDTPEMKAAQQEVDEAELAKMQWEEEMGPYPSIPDWVRMTRDWTSQQKTEWDDAQRPGQDIRGRLWRAKKELAETRDRVFKNELQRRRKLAPKGTMETRLNNTKPATARIERQVHHAATKLPETWIKNVGRVGVEHSGGRGEWNGRRIQSRSQSVTMHELGHAVEERNPEIHRLVTDFFSARIAERGEHPKWLGKGYRDDEVHFPGMFPDDYTSKWYGPRGAFIPEDPGDPRSTEILSMGLQSLFYKQNWAKDLWESDDQEFRNFLLGLLFDHDRTDAEKDLDLSADMPDPNLPSTTNTGNQGTFRAIVGKKEVDARLIRYAPDGKKVYVEANGRKTWIDASKIVTGGRTEVTDPSTVGPEDVTLEEGSKKGQLIAVSKNGTEVGRLTKQANGWAFTRPDGTTDTGSSKEEALANGLSTKKAADELGIDLSGLSNSELGLSDPPKPGQPDWPGHHLDSLAFPKSPEEAKANREAFAAQGATEAQIAEMVARWTGAGVDLSDSRDKFVEELEAGKFNQAIDAMRNGSLTPELTDGPPLFRGIRAIDEDSNAYIENLKVGDTHDLRHFASFTEKPNHAQAMAGWDTTVVFEVEPNGRGLNVAPISNTPHEREWFMSGKLEITEIVSREESHHPDEEFGTVRLHVRARHIDESDTADKPEPPKPPAAVPKPPEAPGGRPGAAKREEMAKAFYAGYEDGEELTGGQMSLSVKRVTLSDGTMGVLKGHEWDGEARREVLANVVSNALGFDTHTIDVGDNRSLHTFIDGDVGEDWGLAQLGPPKITDVEELDRRAEILAAHTDWTFDEAENAAHVLDLPGARELGIMDFLIRNRDRHQFNWKVGSDGQVKPLDHGMTFFTPEGADRDVPRSPFSTYWAGHEDLKPSARAGFGVDPGLRAKPSTKVIREGDLRPRVSKAYLGELRARLELGRSEFTDSEWAAIIARLDMLTAAAPDTIAGEQPMEAMT
jgi:DNA topoisomerase IB